MQTHSKPVRTQFGTLHIRVIAADPHSYHDSERGNVTDLRPMLEVSSHGDFGDVRTARDWTVRGRTYGVHFRLYREDLSHLRGANGQPMDVWHRSGYQPYNGKIRNDRGGEVQYGTATWDAVWDAVIKAVETFTGERPGWDELSRYLLHDADASAAHSRAMDARREAERHDAEADRHYALRNGTNVPDALLSMINN